MQKKDKKSELCKKCDFSLRHYQEILGLFKEQNYKFCFFSEKPNQKIKKIYLRHDIDYSPEKALKLARIEHKNKVHSTFFVRLSAPFYNIFDPTYSRTIKEIIRLGHQVGLHFEGDINDSTNLMQETIEKEVFNQIKILKTYFDVKKIVSFHCPSKFIFNQEFKTFISSYTARFFSEIKYLSDSKGNWREGCVCQWLTSPSPPSKLQILVHPIWWGRKEKNPNKYLNQYLKDRFKYLDSALAKDSSIYKTKFSL